MTSINDYLYEIEKEIIYKQVEFIDIDDIS